MTTNRLGARRELEAHERCDAPPVRACFETDPEVASE
jgi:hypothetical protein